MAKSKRDDSPAPKPVEQPALPPTVCDGGALTDILIPPRLQALRVQGTHSIGIKALGWGEPGGGKSFFMASFPSPKVCIVPGDHGIEPFLSEEDLPFVFDVSNPVELREAVDFALKNEDKFKSVIIDPLTLAWEDWMDSFSDEFGGEIKAKNWRAVKGPWKILWRKLMASSLHVGITAWVDDILYSAPEVAPGIQGKLEVLQQMKPKIEKRVPHIFHIALQFSIMRNNLGEPLPKHIAKVTKARRPRNVDPKDLHVGKTWKFDELKPQSPWEAIIEPFLPAWQAGGAVTHIGVDHQEAEADMADLKREYQDTSVGQILRMIAKPYKDMGEYKKVWQEKIEEIVQQLDKEHQGLVREAHVKKKKELGG